MFPFERLSSQDATDTWRYQLDRFVQENQLPLAALNWGLRQQWDDAQAVLGIDLKPTPHFVRCSRKAIEQLNEKVDRQIQEILGILDGYDPEQEVVMLGIGDGQIKLIYFQADSPLSVCWEQWDRDTDRLIQQLEERLALLLSPKIEPPA